VEGHFKYKYLDNDPECYHVADQGQGVDEGILKCLQMARDTITTMEDNFNAGRPGFSCDVIDEIDRAINLLARQPMVGDVQPVQFLCDDLILKIVEICEEPELVVWKIAKVRELLTQQGKPQKRTVTRDFQRPHAKRLTNLFLKYWYVTHDKSSEESDRIQFWTEANNFIDKMLNELGIEVTE